MFTWNVEECKLMKESEEKPKLKYFTADGETSREDKIAFIDSQTDGLMTALLKLYEKFQAEADKLKRDKWGIIKQNSIVAWMRRNTKDGKIRFSEHSGELYSLYGTERRIDNLMTRRTWDSYDDIVDEMFHRLLCRCLKEERAWFAKHDEYSVLSRKLIDSPYMPLLGISYWWGTDGIGVKDENGKSVKFTLEELRFLSDKCDKLAEKVSDYAAEVSGKFGDFHRKATQDCEPLEDADNEGVPF